MSFPDQPNAAAPVTQKASLAPPRGRARRRLWADRSARGVVVAGGASVIASILGILVFLLIETGPLLRAPRVAPARAVATAERAPRALLVDEHRTHAATLGLDGIVRITDLGSGAQVREQQLPGPTGLEPPPGLSGAGRPVAAPPPFEAVTAHAADGLLAGARADGRVVVVPVDWRIEFEQQTRRVRPELGETVELDVDPEGRALGPIAVRHSDAGTAVAAQLADGSLALVRQRVRENLLTGARESSLERRRLESPVSLTQLLLDADQRNLYAGSRGGELLWWQLGGEAPETPKRVVASAAPLTALALLIGERSLVVGAADGSLALWFPVRPRRGEAELARIRSFPDQEGPVRLLVASQRNRTFLTLDGAGGLGLFYSTSGRVLWRGHSPLARPSAAAFAPKGNAVWLGGEGQLRELDVDNPHPEITWSALFGKLWYEGAPEPQYVWQSTGGTDDFEPKLSLVPLLVGTLKGTLYSLVLAIPLGVFGAMYTSQFMHPRLQRLVKPTVEIMASLPSVVLGFLAGLWLAPRLERAFPGLLLCLLAFPLLSLLAGALFQALPRRLRGRLPEGAEVAWFATLLAAGLAGCFALGGALEQWLFGGSFSGWLLDWSGTRYDQRNAVVIGIAMGFAVIPIIFAISEDAFSNVPRSLSAASRALGANRWQTVVRVVLPTASPGIFSAIMVGFGRAVGETMIVLMATGNTPILDWSPFNGFRTLSANIAVEIPEAPVGGTLYRVLFVAALLLFALTFLVNTLAEVIRHRLRQRFARL